MSKFQEIDPTRNCLRCDGGGVAKYDKSLACPACKGKGTFMRPDFKEIMNVIFTAPKKSGKISFRKAFPPKLHRFTDIEAGRSYYVWRLARFHGGADVTMPYTADLILRGDPYRHELDALSELVANAAFGTNIAAAVRWGQALGYLTSTPAGLPASAYEGGPVADNHKLADEALELT